MFRIWWSEWSMACASFAKAASRPDILRRSLKVSVVVGTALTLINHGDKLISSGAEPGDVLRILLTYAIPFSVSTWASVQSGRLFSAEDR